MAEEFAALGKLAKLGEDAQKAAELLDGASDDNPTSPPSMTKPRRDRPNASKTESAGKPQDTVTASPKNIEVIRTRQVSTMLGIETHRRVMRAAKLQAADEKKPDSLWAILDEAANRWCDENCY